MRLIQLKVPRGNHQAVQEVLEENDVEYVVIDTLDEEDKSAIIQFPLPRPAVEPILERLHDIGMDEDFRVSLTAETIRVNNSKNLVDQLLHNGEQRDIIPQEELLDKARDMISNWFTYYFMTALGTLVATSGLLLNSAAVVIGAMVLAPQLGAALMASVGITTNDRKMLFGGLIHQMIGLGFGFIGATVFATVLRWTDLLVIPMSNIMTLTEVSSRISPGPLSMVISVAAGAAAAFNLATQDRPTGPLVGVMMSAALIPAAATAGIGVAWLHHRIIIGALLLLAVNVASINLTGPIVLWLLGYRPTGWYDMTSPLIKFRSILPVFLLLVAVFLSSGFLLGQQVAYVYTVNAVVEETLDDDKYDEVELRRTHANYNYLGQMVDPPQITVIIDRPDGDQYPELATALQRKIINETGDDVVVTVEYVDSMDNMSAEENGSARISSKITSTVLGPSRKENVRGGVIGSSCRSG